MASIVSSCQFLDSYTGTCVNGYFNSGPYYYEFRCGTGSWGSHTTSLGYSHLTCLGLCETSQGCIASQWDGDDHCYFYTQTLTNLDSTGPMVGAIRLFSDPCAVVTTTTSRTTTSESTTTSSTSTTTSETTTSTTTEATTTSSSSSSTTTSSTTAPTTTSSTTSESTTSSSSTTSESTTSSSSTSESTTSSTTTESTSSSTTESTSSSTTESTTSTSETTTSETTTSETSTTTDYTTPWTTTEPYTTSTTKKPKPSTWTTSTISDCSPWTEEEECEDEDGSTSTKTHTIYPTGCKTEESKTEWEDLKSTTKWKAWPTTTSADPWNTWSKPKPGSDDWYTKVTVITTSYVSVCPTGYTTVPYTKTITWSHPKAATTKYVWPVDEDGCPSGFTTTTTLCGYGCGKPWATVTVTIPVKEDVSKETSVDYWAWLTKSGEAAASKTGADAKAINTAADTKATNTEIWKTWSAEPSSKVKVWTGAASNVVVGSLSIVVCGLIAGLLIL